MANPFKTLDTFFNPDLVLPVTAEKSYTIKPVDATTGAQVTAIMGIAARMQLNETEPTSEDIASITLSDDQQQDMYRRVLGDTYDELIEDGANWAVLQLVGTTTIIWITNGIEIAEEYWNAGGDPKARKRKKPADRKQRSAK